MWDLHTHSRFSHDAEFPIPVMAAAAVKRGVRVLGFAEHIDFDTAGVREGKAPADLEARHREREGYRETFPGLDLRYGAEVSLQNSSVAERSLAWIGAVPLDYVIGSVHSVDGVGAYVPAFYGGGSREETNRRYLEAVARLLPTCPWFDVLGHYDFAAKHAPYPDPAVCYRDAPDALDRIFRYLIQNGKGMEVNTSAWRKRPWGLDVLKRYRELGGEIVTLGSDAHSPAFVGNRLEEARELVRAAGFRIIATYRDRRPVFHAIG